ncbi:MAG: hypothetical protein B6U68_02640 [Candidatus Aenigmarchaeota archaeon ex4484_14]|nr:MAG: hypothetical protein B6U68_02640 [Candidatus Aenigmarchaeota archaeon ex4484_14]
MGTGFGRGFGRRGHRRMFYATGLPGWVRFGTSPTSLAQVNKDQQIKLLEQEKTRLEQELQNIIKRLEELRKCGYKMPHQRGVPCYQQKCPKCGTMMTRAR